MNVDDTSRKTRTRFRESQYTQEKCSTFRDKAVEGRIAARVPEALSTQGCLRDDYKSSNKAKDDAINFLIEI